MVRVSGDNRRHQRRIEAARQQHAERDIRHEALHDRTAESLPDLAGGRSARREDIRFAPRRAVKPPQLSVRVYMAGRELLEPRTDRLQGLHLGRKPQAPVTTMPPVQRHDADRVARCQNVAGVPIGKHEGEDSIEITDKVGPTLLVQMDNHLTVGSGGEFVMAS